MRTLFLFIKPSMPTQVTYAAYGEVCSTFLIRRSTPGRNYDCNNTPIYIS